MNDDTLRMVLLERLTRRFGSGPNLDRVQSMDLKGLIVEATAQRLYPGSCFDCLFRVELDCHIPFYVPRHSLGTLVLEETKKMGEECKMYRR